ncbi:DUF5385 family protein [Candidatus Mycoplasma haematominutum]|uniref:Uncharacterized protein n=1 Tax=Candidatus Mycoplasma haematominutum 'Birmingham 1' TaxID=1116213 RepID=G8C389_9MOLU|nr:DUF5385 family protein [Candidatus Mycoplasma haematominutum]CCE66787.1 conserved haemoplasma hypothetical protein [Candidatus Mycoplasma haematominutum 'Birmingham 1']
MLSSLFLSSLGSGFASVVPVALVIATFWFVAKKKREKSNRVKRKEDAWYILKDYLKRSGRQGYRVYDLRLYPRTNIIISLRDYIKTSRESLEKENARLLNRKVERKSLKTVMVDKWTGKWKKISFPLEEKYHRELELQTLKVLAAQSSYYQSYLQEYNNWSTKAEFQELIKGKLIGESLAKLTKNKKLGSRSRYLVCFKTIDREGRITDWEAIEVELLKVPRKAGADKYKILFTAIIDYRKELHWIYSLQLRHYKDKREALKNAEREARAQARRVKTGKIIYKIFFLDYLIPAATFIRNKVRKN